MSILKKQVDTSCIHAVKLENGQVLECSCPYFSSKPKPTWLYFSDGPWDFAICRWCKHSVECHKNVSAKDLPKL